MKKQYRELKDNLTVLDNLEFQIVCYQQISKKLDHDHSNEINKLKICCNKIEQKIEEIINNKKELNQKEHILKILEEEYKDWGVCDASYEFKGGAFQALSILKHRIKEEITDESNI